MKTFTQPIMAMALVFLFAACAQKTQETATANRPSSERNNQDRPKRSGPPQFSELLAKMDTNQDGQLSVSEVQGRLKDNFTTIDADGNGFITETEMKNAPRPKRRGRN